MSQIRKYRVNADYKDSWPEFYFKFERDDGKILCNICVDASGIYYYRAKSQILSPKENRNARESYDGFISMENLSDIFESLRRAQLREAADDGKLKVIRSRKKLTIEAE